ncbi:MAG: BadF/BadG/BcrA/BcrD ATPase family protein [Longimicrobiales bacterium]
MTATYAIGVDGGGTHARAVVLDEGGREVGRAEAPGAVVSLRAPQAAAEAVAHAVRGAAQAGGVSLPVAALWAGLAGAGHEASRLGVERALTAAGLARRVRVGTDVEAAFHAAFPEGPGLMVIAGTGSIAWGRRPAGDLCRVGGWGQQLGDEGSGYSIGLKALRAVARAEDERTGPTTLTVEVLAALGLEAPGELIPWAAGSTKAEMAALVPVVVRCANAGDRTAHDILEDAAGQVDAHVAALLRRTGPWTSRPGLLLSGGLIAPGGSLRSRLERRLAAHAVDLRSDEVDAAVGAAMLARATLSGSR